MDKPVILCFRTTLGTPHVQGTVLKACKRCEEPVWVAPSSLAIIERYRGGMFLCDLCFPEVIRDPNFDPPSAAQLADMPPVIQEAFLAMVERMKQIPSGGQKKGH